MPNLEPILNYGVLGILVVLLLLGYLVPKWVLDEYRKRESIKDAIIERQAAAIERIADKIEAKL